MKEINNKIFKKINLDKSNLYVITDFDNTITDGNSIGSLNVITESRYVDEKYRKKYAWLVKKYKSKITSNTNYFLKKKLWAKHLKKYLKMFKEYNLSEDLLEKIVKSSNIKIRNNFDIFLQKLHENKIPVIIVSSGFGNTIETILRVNNLYYDNIFIISNFVKFDNNGMICKIPKKIITPVTKNKIRLSHKIRRFLLNRNSKLIFGDVPDDIGMTKINKSHNTISFAFCNANNKVELLKKYDFILNDDDIKKISETIME